VFNVCKCVNSMLFFSKMRVLIIGWLDKWLKTTKNDGPAAFQHADDHRFYDYLSSFKVWLTFFDESSDPYRKIMFIDKWRQTLPQVRLAINTFSNRYFNGL